MLQSEIWYINLEEEEDKEKCLLLTIGLITLYVRDWSFLKLETHLG